MPRVGRKWGSPIPSDLARKPSPALATFGAGEIQGCCFWSGCARAAHGFGCLNGRSLGSSSDREFELPGSSGGDRTLRLQSGEVLEEAGLGRNPARLSRREISLVMEVGSPLLPAEHCAKLRAARRDCSKRDELGQNSWKPDRGASRQRPGERRVQRCAGSVLPP